MKSISEHRGALRGSRLGAGSVGRNEKRGGKSRENRSRRETNRVEKKTERGERGGAGGQEPPKHAASMSEHTTAKPACVCDDNA